MLSKFFIYRPIFASVISVLIVMAGGVSIFTLPIAQYPEICPPVVQVTASYPGADPQTVVDTVAAPIEAQVNGVDHMLYMCSTSASDGSYTLNVTFELGTDVDMANVLVQNRVSWAMSQLPMPVQQQGIITKKVSTTMVSIVSIYCDKDQAGNEKYDDLFMVNYAQTNIVDEISRIGGVGNVNMFPVKYYSMRVWLDPNKMEALSLTTNDVVSALQEQNVQVSAGQLGQSPSPAGTNFQLTVNTQGQFKKPEDFAEIILRAKDNGIVRVKDVARVELGGQSYDTSARFNDSTGATLIIYQMPGSNLVDVAEKVRETMAGLGKEFPAGMHYKIIYQISDFILASIDEVIKTLFEAFILVFIVVYIFLQNWRATLIPMITIPVSVIGTFFVMMLMGFSINMITLFGMVLAIGIVVDDAIVVVENVERNMTEYGLTGRQAAIRAMKEITGAIVGITLVLMSVFLPAAFMPGITGRMYSQFSLTIAITTLFSAINALTLSPALCALLLKPSHGGPKFILFRKFNDAFGKLTNGYVSLIGVAVRKIGFMLVIFAGLLALTYFGFMKVPTGFIPSEDDGLVMVNIQLPDGANLQRTEEVTKRVIQILQETDGVADIGANSGYSVLDSVTCAYTGIVFAPLDPWDKRSRTKPQIMAELAVKFAGIKEAIVLPFSLPPIMGLGKGSGFEMYVQDKNGIGMPRLLGEVSKLCYAANTDPDRKVQNVYTTYRASVPTIYVDIDRTMAVNMHLDLSTVFKTLQSYLGSSYVNNFPLYSKTWQVRVQGDSEFRVKPEDIARLQVRNADGKMVPFSSFAMVRETTGPMRIDRYNMYPAIRVGGEAAPGVGSVEALDVMDTIAARELPEGVDTLWTNMALQERLASNPTIIFVLAVIVVVLILAAQYESWFDPIAVVLIVPLAALGAVVALLARGFENNLYTQVGLTLLVGLAAKNAILIVEFAREQRLAGKDMITATIEGAKLRLRPILMTSFAFVFGVLPLAVATGAGAVSRQTLGTGVVGGMLCVTIFGVIFAPVMYVLMQKIGMTTGTMKHASQEEAADAQKTEMQSH